MKNDFVIRTGLYVVYRGEEYKAYKKQNGSYFIEKLGEIPESALEDIYFIRTVVCAGGEEFEAEYDGGDFIAAGTSRRETAKKFDMEEIDRHDFRGKLPKFSIDSFREYKDFFLR